MTYIKKEQLKNINRRELSVRELSFGELVRILCSAVFALIVLYMIAKSGVVPYEYDSLYQFAAALENSFPFLEKLYQFIFM